MKTKHEIPGLTAHRHQVSIAVGEAGIPCSVTLEWVDRGSPYVQESKDALAERMKRIEEAAKAFLGSLYEEDSDD